MSVISSHPATPPIIQLYTLGKFKLIIAGQDATALLNYDKAKLLLVIVALSNHAVTRAQLAEMLWSEIDSDKARARLRHALHILRQAFQAYPEALEVSSTHIRLESKSVFVDIIDFLSLNPDTPISELKQKLDLYSASFLQDSKPPLGDLYLNWYQAWQTRHEIELAQYRHQLVNHYLDKNETDAALTYVKWWLLQTPEDEACHRYLIRLYLANGDRDAALRAYQHCEQILQERFNTEPSLETQSLLQQTLPTKQLFPSALDSLAHEHTLRPVASLAIVVSPAQVNENLSLDRSYENHINDLQKQQEQIIRLCNDYGAWVTQSQSPALLVHFGYPVVRERPISSALELALALLELVRPQGLTLRLAVHACTILFQNPPSFCLDNWMAQQVLPLVWKAEPNEILLTAQAAARLSDIPVHSFDHHGTRLFKLGPLTKNEKLGLTRIYGRMAYFDTLIQQWARYIPGQPPTFIHIQGHAGVGKTQLANAIADYIKNVEGRVLYLCNQEDKTHTPYHALAQWLIKQLMPLEFSATNSRESNQTERYHLHLKQQLGIRPTTSQALLDLLFFQAQPNQTSAYTAATNAIFLQLFKEYVNPKQPLCIIWDNLQWLDPASHQLIKHLQEHSTGIAMVIGLNRLPANYTWPLIQLHLDALTPSAIADYLHDQSKQQKIPNELKQFIAESNITNPQHLNDILHLHRLTLPYQELPRLTDMLAARLCFMNETQQKILFLNALLTPVNTELIQAVLQLENSTIVAALEHLVAGGLLSWEDKHLLCNEMHKMALLSLMPSEIKRFICEAIARFFIRSDQPSAVIATYLHTAQSPESAVWWQKAINSALDQGQIQLAQEHAVQALLSQNYIVNHEQRALYAFNNHATLGNLAIASHGPAAPTTIAAYHDAAKNSEQENALQSCTIFWGKWLTQHSLGQFSASLSSAERLQKSALKANNEVWLGWSFYAQAQYHLFTGNPEVSEKLLLQCITTINLANDLEQTPGFHGAHSYALAYGALGLAQAFIGRYSSALQNTKHAILLAEQSPNPIPLIACRLHLLRIYYLTNNLRSLQTESEALLSLFPEQNRDSVWFHFIWTYAHSAAHLQAPSKSHLTHILNARPNIEQNMPSAMVAYLCILARCHLALDEDEEALAVLDEAQTLLQEQQSLQLIPEVALIKGDIWQHLNRPDLAQVEWQKAHSTARDLNLLIYVDWVKERLPL